MQKFRSTVLLSTLMKELEYIIVNYFDELSIITLTTLFIIGYSSTLYIVNFLEDFSYFQVLLVETSVLSVIKRVAQILGTDFEKLAVNGVRRLLEEELAKIESQIAEILSKYGVKSIRELEERFLKKEFPEHPTWEDLIDLKYLEEERKKIQEALNVLQRSE